MQLTIPTMKQVEVDGTNHASSAMAWRINLGPILIAIHADLLSQPTDPINPTWKTDEAQHVALVYKLLGSVSPFAPELDAKKASKRLREIADHIDLIESTK